MLIASAEESFQKGQRALDQGRRREAMALFEAAIELERRLSSQRPQARYLSFYGMCLGLEMNENREALRFCREAVTLEGYNADLRCNLGRVLLAAGRRKEAFESLTRGLHLSQSHAEIVRQIRLMGLRKRPPVPFLARGNPINIFFGRMRANAKRNDAGRPTRRRASAA